VTVRGIFILALLAGTAATAPPDARTRGTAATVKVESAADGQTGSGAVIAVEGPHGYVLTAAHVVASAKAVQVRTAAGKSATAEVLAKDAVTDLAVLRLPAVGLPDPVRLVKPGTTPKATVSVGWEKGDAPTALDEAITRKVHLRKPGADAAVWCWQAERKQVAGRSGGPLLDETGAVVGVASGHDGAAGYYVHADEVHTFLRRNGLKWLAGDGK
jgi:S1-C subfamily serine protease